MIVEHSIIFPLFILLTLGTVDLAYMLHEWALANKAAYVGARRAVVSNPVAQNITNNADLGYTATQLQNVGALNGADACFNLSDGSSNGNCPSTGRIICTSTACNPTTYGFDSVAFTNIFNAMQPVFPRLQTTNVTIWYETNGSGYVARPGGLPMNVTVSITGMQHQFFFAPGLLRLFGGGVNAAPNIPPFQTTMQSEAMVTQ
jgi:hypothetical protein